MKRPWPEEDDLFWITVALSIFFTICISIYIGLILEDIPYVF